MSPDGRLTLQEAIAHADRRLGELEKKLGKKDDDDDDWDDDWDDDDDFDSLTEDVLNS